MSFTPSNPVNPPVRVLPGQGLAYRPGSGYVATGKANVPKFKPSGSPGTRPSGASNKKTITTKVDPYAALSAGAVDDAATASANAGLTVKQQAIKQQQDVAAAQARADEDAITGFQTAASGILKTIPGQISAGYDAAAKTAGDIGTNVGGAVGADLKSATDASQALEAAQGQSGGTTVDSGDLGANVSYLGGVIPGSSIAEQGAAASAEAASAEALPLDAGHEELTARMASARATNDTYAQQLISLAATFPALKAQALQQLNSYEVEKAKYRDSVKTNAANVHIRQESLDAQRKALGQRTSYENNHLKYLYAGLRFRSQQDAAKAAAKGQIIDVGASKLLGHIVYKDGTQDPSIHVKQSNTPGGITQTAKLKAMSGARVGGYKYAIQLLGKPLSTPKGQGTGKYIADPKYNSVSFPPLYHTAPYTTNNPSRASHKSTASDYADAQAKVYAEYGDSLVTVYGYSKEQAMAAVNTALARAGWKK